MPTLPITKRYYPKLSELITVDDLPEFLSFVQGGLNSVLDHIHYKNFQFSKSARGDSAFYSLEIVAKQVGLDLPFGLRFVLNPDLTGGDTAISSFPISLQYQWEVLAFLRSFNLQNFSFTPQALFELGLKIFRISDEQVLAHTLNNFVQATNDGTTAYQNLITSVNQQFGTSITLPADPTVSIVSELIRQEANISQGVSVAMFVVYLSHGSVDDVKNKLQQFFNLMMPDGIEDYIRKLIVPKAKATLTLDAGIQFPPSILQPVDAQGNAQSGNSIFAVSGATLIVDTEAGIEFETEMSGTLIPQYNQIGNTGLIITFQKAKLDLSRVTNIPEADAAGYPVDFVGLYVQRAAITFTKFGADSAAGASATIYADNLLIGTGGISGTIGLETTGHALRRSFGAFEVELDTFAMTFRQNAITKCNISGILTLPKFEVNGAPAQIGIQASIRDNGDFSVTAKSLTSPIPISLLKVFNLSLRSLELGHKDGLYYVSVAGVLDFTAQLPVFSDLLPKGLEIQKLLIREDGHLEFEGGGLVVPKSFKLQIGPVKLEVSHISLGSYSKTVALDGRPAMERNYAYFGFDGMINTGSAGVNAQGNGIKFYFTTDTDDAAGKIFDCFIRIDSLAIDITIPGNVSKEDASVILNGYLSVTNPTKINPNDPIPPGTEYTGAISFALPKLHIGGSAAMRLNPDVPSFLVDIDLELGTPLPLGPTGLGLYGLRGLVGSHYVPSKSAAAGVQESDTWWKYYKAPSAFTHREGIEADKFADKSGFSIGAGASIATAFDSGFTFSSKIFLLLGLPDVFLLQGQAGVLRSRIGLADDTDPPFSALIAFSSTSIEASLGVNFQIPFILSLQGTLEMAFFFNNASGWYLNVGRDQPETARIRASVLSLFQGYAYLMISSQGIRAGAGAHFDFQRSFGPVGFGIGAYIDLSGHISFKPFQIGGRIAFGGYAYLRVWRFKFGLGVDISLAAEAPHPINIVGTLQIRIGLPWPFKDIKITAEIRLGGSDNNSDLFNEILVLDNPSPATGYTPAIATNIMSNETFQVNFTTIQGQIPPPDQGGWSYLFKDTVVPLDSFIDIELLKPVKPGNLLGGSANQVPDGYQELLPPQRGVNDQVKHEYALTNLEIFAWSNGSWVTYNIYDAVTAIVNSNVGSNHVDLTQLKPGYWQFADKNKYNKIRLLSQNMFSYNNGSTNGQLDMDGLGFTPGDVFCYEMISKRTVINWSKEHVTGPDVTDYPDGVITGFKGLSFLPSGIKGKIGPNLELSGRQGRVVITIPSSVTDFELDFADIQHDITVEFIRTIYITGIFSRAIPRDFQVYTKQLLKTGTDRTVDYIGTNGPADKVLIMFNPQLIPDYTGDLVFGGHWPLPESSLITGLTKDDLLLEKDRSLLYGVLYNAALTPADVISRPYSNFANVAGIWSLNTPYDAALHHMGGLINGSPDRAAGFYALSSGSPLNEQDVYAYTGSDDALVIPYRPELKVEGGSFSFELTVAFDPFVKGISTLLCKVTEDPETGNRKGYSLHLLQTGRSVDAVYDTASEIPSYAIVLTCYSGQVSSAVRVAGTYTLDCASSKLLDRQYKNIAVSVDRDAGDLSVYVDKIRVANQPIPAELGTVDNASYDSYLHEISYTTTSQQARMTDNGITQDLVLNEVQIMADALNKTVQPVWRPETTYAVRLTTTDTVNGHAPPFTRQHVFGFRTAGPVGHFHQQNPQYQQLAEKEQGDQFKLSNLKYYIDYERSAPDAQSRYELSKPVFPVDAQVKLYFTQPYINAMFSNWDGYLGLPQVQSSLDIKLISPAGAEVVPQLMDDAPQPVTTIDPYSLPPDQRYLYFLDKFAVEYETCHTQSISLKKKLTQRSYHFPPLSPNSLYTAVFMATYNPNGAPDADHYEVHKYSFKTSIYDTFLKQAGSLVLNPDTGNDQYAVQQIKFGFSAMDIGNLKKLIDEDATNDPDSVARYAVKYDRLLYGGLKQIHLEPVLNTTVTLLVNADPVSHDRTLLGILVRNPEPFNDPKFSSDILAGTVGLVLTLPDQSVDQSAYTYIHSRDTSGVIITNADLNLPFGKFQLTFVHKIFDGENYVVAATYPAPPIDMTPYLT